MLFAGKAKSRSYTRKETFRIVPTKNQTVERFG